MRVIDEQGRVTEYVYDAAGNILQVIVSGAGSAQPPVVTASSPGSIRVGETKTVQITGTGLVGAHVSTTDPGLDISGLQITATQITFSLTATATALLGSRTISISNAGGSTSVQIFVNPVLPKLNMSPLPIAVPPTGAGRNFFVTLSSPDNIDHVVSLASSNSAIMTVSPASVTFTAGQTEKLVTVTGRLAGNAAVNLSSPLLVPNSVPVFVTAEFSGITTSFAPLLQVVKEAAPGGSSTFFGPFTAQLGIAKGAYIDGVTPNRLGRGTGPVDLVISGNELGGVTGVTISPPDGVTLGSISIAADGRSVTVPVTVAASAPTTTRTIRLAGSSQPYIALRPGADQVLVTLPAPQIDSIDPIFATTGTTAATLTIRGRNLQSPQSVTFAPGTGITVSASPVASADGTSLTVAYTVSPLAPAGSHLVRVNTVGGSSDAAATAANTFSVVNEVVATHTPIASAHLGVVKEDAAPPPPLRTDFAPLLGVIVPPAAIAMSPTVGVIGTTVNLTITGAGLHSITSVQMLPPDGVSLGAPSPAADGTSLTIPVTIALSAPQTLRTVRLMAGSLNVAFASQNAALFRVSAPLPEFDSMSPIVLQVGAAAVSVTMVGRNFQNASAVRLDPSTGTTLSPPTVGGHGTLISFTASAGAGAATGPRTVIVTTPAGDSSAVQTPANTLTLVNTIVGPVTPVVAMELGVVLESTAPPATQFFGPFVSADVGVVLETAPAQPAPDTARALNLGVAVGAFSNGVQVPPLTPTSTGTLVISGVGLADVSAVQIEPATGISLGALTLAPDGTQVSVPLTLTNAAAGLRGVRVLRGAEQVTFVPGGNNTFRVGVGVPSIDSITPILESPGQTFTMTLRGQNFQGTSRVTATPGTGIFIDNAPSVNAAGTEVQVRISIGADAPAGAHVFQVHTPGGATTDAPVPANTFTVLE